MYGTCFSSEECNSKGGTVDGNCASGFGVCCTFTLNTCSSTVSQNCSYITNPSYPTTFSTAGSCSFAVTPISTDICQLRLDFNVLDITEATTGVCTDSFTATGPTGRNPPVVCGTLTGEHMYIEQGQSSTATTLAFTIATGGTWKIKVSQIECSNKAKAPQDCYQYFTGASGTITSVNFAGSNPIQNIYYTQCTRREKGYCGIQYTPSGVTTPDNFKLDNANDNLNTNFQLANVATSEAYIGIPGSAVDYYSGDIFSETTGIAQGVDGTVLQSKGRTFRIEAIFNAITQTGNSGYSLAYTQAPCSLPVQT